MTDNLSPADRRRTMRAVKGSGTTPERRLRAMLTSNGIHGWHMNSAQVEGKPDIAFPDRRLAIFVDGCFWHACPVCRRALPRTNSEYWERKIARNRCLAAQYNRQLRKEGWAVVRIWEHELRERASRRRALARVLTALAKKEQGE